MKTKLKFFLVLLAMMVGGVNYTWAAVVYEVWDFDNSTKFPDNTSLDYATAHEWGKNITQLGKINFPIGKKVFPSWVIKIGVFYNDLSIIIF